MLSSQAGGTYPCPEFAVSDPPNDNSDETWNSVLGSIAEFVVFVPEAVYVGPFKTVTQKGYIDKIHKLFPGYALNVEVDKFLLKVTTSTHFVKPLHGGEALMQGSADAVTLTGAQ
jgi:hypothetical protein